MQLKVCLEQVKKQVPKKILTFTLVWLSCTIGVPPFASMFSLSKPNHRSISFCSAQYTMIGLRLTPAGGKGHKFRQGKCHRGFAS